jgi:site-specific recombinase XerD
MYVALRRKRRAAGRTAGVLRHIENYLDTARLLDPSGELNVFDRLFTRPAAIARHRNGPHASARERFLVQCMDEGYSPSMLRKIAWQLLVVASTVDFRCRTLSVGEIARAATRPIRVIRHRNSDGADSTHQTRQLFVSVATKWLGFLGRLKPERTNDTALTTLVGQFERYMRDERGLSSVTIRTRGERVNWFLASLPRHRSSMHAISVHDVDEFLGSKGAAGWTRASIDALAASLRSFFRYAQDRQWCAVDIAASIKGPRIFAQEGLPRGASWQDVQRLLADSGGSSAGDIRDHAILMLLALYGLRAGEISTLRLDDVDWDREVLCVTRPKQRCAQQYPWLPSVGDAVLRYLREARPRCARRELFLTMKAPHRPLSSKSVSAVAHAWLTSIDATAARRGAHSLRHACAAHLLARGFTFKQIGDHLGHRSANSTFNYAKVDLAGLRQVAELDMGALL